MSLSQLTLYNSYLEFEFQNPKSQQPTFDVQDAILSNWPLGFHFVKTFACVFYRYANTWLQWGEGCIKFFFQQMDWSNETHFEDTVQSQKSNRFLSYHINIPGFRHVDKEHTSKMATPLSPATLPSVYYFIAIQCILFLRQVTLPAYGEASKNCELNIKQYISVRAIRWYLVRQNYI